MRKNKRSSTKCFICAFAVVVFSLLQPSIQAQGVLSKYAHPEMEKMKFMIGEWKFDTKYILQDGSFGKSESRSIVSSGLNGRVIEDRYCRILANGEIDNIGVTIRSYNARRQKWLMVFYDQDLGSRTEFEGVFKNNEFHFEGKGLHNGVELLEKVIFYNIRENSYSWNMDRSYDGGKTWIKGFFSYEATRLK